MARDVVDIVDTPVASVHRTAAILMGVGWVGWVGWVASACRRDTGPFDLTDRTGDRVGTPFLCHSGSHNDAVLHMVVVVVVDVVVVVVLADHKDSWRPNSVEEPRRTHTAVVTACGQRAILVFRRNTEKCNPADIACKARVSRVFRVFRVFGVFGVFVVQHGWGRVVHLGLGAIR